MDGHQFYRQLFAPIEAVLGPIDLDTIVAIIGFDAGGPLNFCTIGSESGDKYITYVSCELAVRAEQQPNEFGRYELLISCDDEHWVRSIVSDIGRMSLDVAFGDGHTLDIGPWVQPNDPLQGVLFEKVAVTMIDGASYGILRCIGIARDEMEFAQKHGSPELLARLKKSGIYPHTAVGRQSVL